MRKMLTINYQSFNLIIICNIHMKRILFLAASLVMAVMCVSAADVDLAMAQAAAQRFVDNNAAGKRFSGRPAGNLRLLHAESNSVSAGKNVYYIFNTDNSFVIVAGDDRAQQILAHGERPLDMSQMPENMKNWLTTYKRQIEFLQSHPDVQVDAPARGTLRSIPTVAPLLTAEWDQIDPYWNHCPVYNGEYCLTGCPATSLSMVFYYWKYPKDPTPEVESYINLGTGGRLPALPSITFDWDNMLDKYEGVDYTEAQADAVAWLMRYIGQVEHMDYTPEGSGAQGTDILRAVKFFGYDEEAKLLTKSFADNFGNEIEQYFSDEEWADILQKELYEGRPVVYCAFDYNNERGWSGHAFNVDGYDAVDNTYHVNFGWSGIGNGDYVLNAFSYRDYTFNIEQQMITGIQPPIIEPTIRVNAYQLNLQSYVDQTATASILVRGKELQNDITITVNDENGVFSIDETQVSVADADSGKLVTITYAPLASGHHSATIVLSSPDADDVTVSLNGEASLETFRPVMLAPVEEFIGLTQFRADWSDVTLDKYVTSYDLEVNTKPGLALVGETDWSGNTEIPGNFADYPGDLLPEGWTFTGTGLWYEDGGVSINNRSTFITPPYDIAGYEKMTIVVNAKSSMTYSNSKFAVSTSIDSIEFTATGGTPITEYVAVLNCNELEQVKIAGKSGFPVFESIKVYAGEFDDSLLRAAHEEGGANSRYVTGITGKHYTVTDLTPGGMFYYRVKAYYIDGTCSAWSKSKNVTLRENGHAFELGDVNHDGHVSIDDVTTLIDALLEGQVPCAICGDVDGDSSVTIADVSILIDLLLGGN